MVVSVLFLMVVSVLFLIVVSVVARVSVTRWKCPWGLVYKATRLWVFDLGHGPSRVHGWLYRIQQRQEQEQEECQQQPPRGDMTPNSQPTMCTIWGP
jgi:hypothetical protein